jgi:ParB-like chromosome segregation protein Spo0J
MNKLLLLDPDELHLHEEIDETSLERLVAAMEKSQVFYPPLLVDERSRVVLDGHHRFEASKRLGCKKIPCYCVDYLGDENVILDVWRLDMKLTKQDVIETGLGPGKFPSKTTRHIYDLPDSVEPVPMSELFESA